MKKITIVWTIILIMIITGLTIIGFKIKADNIDNIMEESIIKQTEKYFGLYPSLYPSKGNSKTMKVEELINNGYDPELEEGCTGYVTITNGDMGFKYDAYIKCPDYTTKGYDEESQE